MNITQEGELQKQYWGIKEVSDIVGVEQSCIRFWCDEFGVRVHRTQSNHRKFQLKDITYLQVTKYLLQEEKYTIEGTKIKLKLIKFPISALRVEIEVKRQLSQIIAN